MEPIEIIAQVVSIVAMAMNIISYQNKSQRAVITFQLFIICFRILIYSFCFFLFSG